MFRHPQRGTVRDHSELVRRFKRALRAGGVRQVRFHDLRHTFGTRMAAAGVPMPTLQDWMGHRDFKTTLIYADYAPSGHEVGLVERAFSKNGPQLGPPSAEAERPTDPHERRKPRLAGDFVRCAREDSNLHGPYGPQGPQPCASTSSATGAWGRQHSGP